MVNEPTQAGPLALTAIALLLVLLGGSLTGWFGWILLAEFRRKTVRVTAEVIRVDRETSGSSASPLFRPTYRFPGPDGEPTERESLFSASRNWNFEIGERLNVVYDPADPGYIRPAKRSLAIAAPALGVGIGSVPLLLGVKIAWDLFVSLIS